MASSSGIRKIEGNIIKYIILLIFGTIMFFPVLWIFSCSLKTLNGISSYPPQILPKNPQFKNYVDIFTQTNVLLYTRNTVILILGNTLGTLISSSIVAYPLARMKFKGQNIIFGMILATMMVPITTTIIPQYILFGKIGWLDSFLPMIVPAFFAYPYNVFLFRQFFKTIPHSLDESAMLDGCNHWQIFSRVLMPIAKPIYMMIGVLSAIYWWNELFQPLIYINSDSLKPLTIGALTVFKLSGGMQTEWNLTMAMAMAMILPPMVLYMFAGKYLVEGIKTSGLKG